MTELEYVRCISWESITWRMLPSGGSKASQKLRGPLGKVNEIPHLRLSVVFPIADDSCVDQRHEDFKAKVQEKMRKYFKAGSAFEADATFSCFLEVLEDKKGQQLTGKLHDFSSRQFE